MATATSTKSKSNKGNKAKADKLPAPRPVKGRYVAVSRAAMLHNHTPVRPDRTFVKATPEQIKNLPHCICTGGF